MDNSVKKGIKLFVKGTILGIFFYLICAIMLYAFNKVYLLFDYSFIFNVLPSILAFVLLDIENDVKGSLIAYTLYLILHLVFSLSTGHVEIIEPIIVSIFSYVTTYKLLK